MRSARCLLLILLLGGLAAWAIMGCAERPSGRDKWFDEVEEADRRNATTMMLFEYVTWDGAKHIANPGPLPHLYVSWSRGVPETVVVGPDDVLVAASDSFVVLSRDARAEYAEWEEEQRP